MDFLLIGSFLAFLYIEAYQDYKTGSVQLLILVISLIITCIELVVLKGWHSSLESLIYALPVFLIFTFLSYKEKIGMEDTIVLTQIFMLFGSYKFFLITIVSNIMALAYMLVLWTAYGKAVKGVRFVPYIAVSSTIILFLVS